MRIYLGTLVYIYMNPGTMGLLALSLIMLACQICQLNIYNHVLAHMRY
jgi:hypothetical protein